MIVHSLATHHRRILPEHKHHLVRTISDAGAAGRSLGKRVGIVLQPEMAPEPGVARVEGDGSRPVCGEARLIESASPLVPFLRPMAVGACRRGPTR